MVRYGEKRREGTFSRNKLGRKEGSGDETTLIEVYGQVAVHTTQFLLLMQSGSSQAPLEDSIKLSFSFWMVEGSLCITRKTLTTLSLHCAFSELPQFLNTLCWGNLSFPHKLQCTESVALRQVLAPPWAAPLVNWTTRFLRLRSCLVRSFSFGLFSCPFLHLCSSITPSSLSFPHLIFFQWIHFHSKTLQGCIHFAPVIWQILSFSIVGLVLRPSLVGQKLEPCMVVTHVLFVDDENRGDSICHFASFLFQFIEFPFHNSFRKNILKRLTLFVQIFSIIKRVPKRRSGKIPILWEKVKMFDQN